MDSIDLEVLATCAEWLREQRPCLLVTVVKTWGSSPRPQGSMLAIRDDGIVCGSVSGGCIEDDLIASVRGAGIVATLPQVVTYGISSEQAHRYGLPCGGTIQLVIEPLDGDSGIAGLLEQLRTSRQSPGQCLVARRIDLRTGAVDLRPAETGAALTLTDDALVTVHGPRWRLLLIGAGQLSQFIAQIATAMDYCVTVCDPREEHRATWNLPGVDVVHAMPDDLVVDMQPDARCAVVALTHDPKLDDLALMEALQSNAFYVGAIGSRLNNARRCERLKQFGVTPWQLARLHGPVGLDIGSKTPAEIGISILAELTAVRNAVALTPQRLTPSMQAKEMQPVT